MNTDKDIAEDYDEAFAPSAHANATVYTVIGDVMTRLQSKPIKPNRAEDMTLAALTKKLKKPTNRSTSQLR